MQILPEKNSKQNGYQTNYQSILSITDDQHGA